MCTDHVRTIDAVRARYRIVVPDRQLACAPVSSPAGRAYLTAMAAAANFAFANRHAMADRVREAIVRVLGPSIAEATRQVYDVAHNMAKVERHGGRDFLLHRVQRVVDVVQRAGLARRVVRLVPIGVVKG